MLQSSVARVRFALSALGCVVLGASLFNWTQALHTTHHQSTWVDAGASTAPAFDTAEIWQVSAGCVRPYFVRAALRSKAKLKAYYDLAPEAVQAGLDRRPDIQQSTSSPSRYRLVKNQPQNHSANNNDSDMEYAALLHVQYAEWYANVFKLEIEASRWQLRLINVADQRLTLSESARKSFGAYSGRHATMLGAANGFDSQVLATLGLGGFPSDEEGALKANCVKISLVNKILTSPNYLNELWRWPVEQTAAFVLGLQLIFLGIFLVPMMLWIGTGDARLAAQYVLDKANQLMARVRSFDTDRFITGRLDRLQTGRMRILVFGSGVWAKVAPVLSRQGSNIAIHLALSKRLGRT